MDEISKKLIEDKKFSELENRWMELIENPKIQIEDLFEIAHELKVNQESSRALMLLELLAENLFSQGKTYEAIEVYKKMAYFTNNDSKIRDKLVKLYKHLHQKSTQIDDFIELSGLQKGEHLFKSLDKLEEFLKYDKGNVFYFEKLGIGEVIGINPERREVILNFERQSGYHLKFDVADRLLKPVSPSHFLYKKYKEIVELKGLAQGDPIGLVKFLLKSFNEPLSSSEIKKHLTGVVEEKEIDKFWEKVRKKLETDANIEISGETKKFYHYLSVPVDKITQALRTFAEADIDRKYYLAEEHFKKNSEVFVRLLPILVDLGNECYKTCPWLALDIYYLCKSYNKDIEFNYTPNELINSPNLKEIVLKLKNDYHRKCFLREIIEQKSHDWPKVFKEIFLSEIADSKLLDEIEKHLSSLPEILKEIYQTIFFIPQKFPTQFQWLLKRIANGELAEFIIPPLLSRLINSLEHIKGIKQLFLKVLPLGKFDEVIKNATVDDARNIKSAIIESTSLMEYEKNDFLRIIHFYFPELFEKKEEIIYATEAAFKRKRQELEYLLTVEIPANKKEISKAREYGDLSENFEYKAAKEKQDQLYQRLREIESALKKTKIIDLKNVDTSKVSIGTKVILRNLITGELVDYTILGRWDTNLEKNIISNESPLAKDILLGRVRGDKISINEITYEIVDIQPALSNY